MVECQVEQLLVGLFLLEQHTLHLKWLHLGLDPPKPLQQGLQLYQLGCLEQQYLLQKLRNLAQKRNFLLRLVQLKSSTRFWSSYTSQAHLCTSH